MTKEQSDLNRACMRSESRLGSADMAETYFASKEHVLASLKMIGLELTDVWSACYVSCLDVQRERQREMLDVGCRLYIHSSLHTFISVRV